jgi:amino acid transporter
MIFIVFTYGYSSFKPWSVENFFIYYAMLILAPILYLSWKFIKRTKVVSSHELDLVWDAPIIDAYEATFYEPPTSFWREMGQLVGISKKGRGDDRRGSVSSRH